LDPVGAFNETGERPPVVEPGLPQLTHELKTPLSIVLGLCDRLLSDERLAANHADDIERIRGNAYVLLSRVEAVLDLSRLQGGRPRIAFRDTDAVRLARDAVEGFRPVADIAGQALRMDGPPALRAEIDEERFSSILSNLLANALRFTPPGGTVRCSLRAPADRLCLIVADSGPGVPGDMRDAIFEVHHSPARAGTRTGHGLGLAIVREIAALHGGTVTVGDAPEGGAQFTVDMPRRHPEMPAPGPSVPTLGIAQRERPTVESLKAELGADRQRSMSSTEPPVADGRPNVLVLSPDAHFGAFVGDLLTARFAVTHAARLPDVIQRAALRRPDVLLVDLAVGHAGVGALRQRLRETPILGIAARSDEFGELVALGIDDCIVQPFSERELSARIDLLVCRAHHTAERTDAITGLSGAFDVAPVAMALVAPDGRITRANRVLCGLLRSTREEVVDTNVAEFLHWADISEERRRRGLVLEGRRPVDARMCRLRRRDGSYVPARVAVAAVAPGATQRRGVLWHVVPERRASAGDRRRQTPTHRPAITDGPPDSVVATSGK
jgi:PAS domain S-box-containing protein